MNTFKPSNYGTSYYQQGRLGYSSVSQNYGGANRSKLSFMKTLVLTNSIILVRLSICLRMRERNSKKQNKSLSTILTINENYELNFKTN
jgi:hypothetical protein